MSGAPVWISVSGRIGVGKTTLSKALCSRLDGVYVGIGDYVRDEAIRRDIPHEREALQELGTQLIADAGGEAAFVRHVVEAAGATSNDHVVVDGVRTLSMRAELDQLSGARCLHVHVELDDDERARRLSTRGDSADEVHRADSHASEAAFAELREHADLVVGAMGVPDMVTAVVAATSGRRLADDPGNS